MKNSISSNSKSKQKSTGRIALLGVLIALAFILGYLESLLPVFAGIPGIKPGFSNISIITALYLLGKKEAAGLSLVKVVLAGITFGGMFSMLYSLAGAVLSLTVMLILSRIKKLSPAGVSVAGGVAHNMGQIAVACLVTGDAVIYYLPFLVAAGAVSGFITGIISSQLLVRLSRTRLFCRRM